MAASGTRITGRDMLWVVMIAWCGASALMWGLRAPPITWGWASQVSGSLLGMGTGVWGLYHHAKPKPPKDTRRRDEAIGRWIERLAISVGLAALLVTAVVVVWFV